MNNIMFWLLPLFTALTGWLTLRIVINMVFFPVRPRRFLGISVQGILPARQNKIAAQAGRLVATEFIDVAAFTDTLKNEEQLKKLTPTIEKHLDHFLAVKLKEKLPVISVFVGESTLQKIKEGMLEEIELLLPDIISQYTASLSQNLDIQQLVSDKIAGFLPEKFEGVFKSIRKDLRPLEFAAAIIGFLLGLVQLGLSLVLIPGTIF